MGGWPPRWATEATEMWCTGLACAMGLMTGSGPLGPAPAGSWNFEAPRPGAAVYVEPTGKRVRAQLAGQMVADSTRALLLSESGHQPVYYFPRRDVRLDLLRPSRRQSADPNKGVASYYDATFGPRLEPDVAWEYPEPLVGVRTIKDHVAFDFHRMDRWLEEDEEIFEHPKDPYHRIDVYRTSRRVRVSLAGELLAESSRPLALFESNLPVRWYLPAEDVHARLVPSSTVTTCGYKGRANYYNVELVSGEVVLDVVWYYRQPLRDGVAVRDLLCFFNERVDVELDGEPQPRPRTPWSAGALEGEA